MSDTIASVDLGHPINCTCDICWQIDSTNIVASAPKGHWTPLKLEWIRHLRQRPLNWTLEPGHCALCGGTKLTDIYDHFQFKPYNVQVVSGITYMSWLFANDSGSHAAYVSATKKGKDFLRDWTARCLLSGSLPIDSPNYWQTLDALAKKASKIAVREVLREEEVWTEIRVGIDG